MDRHGGMEWKGMGMEGHGGMDPWIGMAGRGGKDTWIGMEGRGGMDP